MRVRAQGTIEYLVILGVIIVISLIVTSLIINQTNSAYNISTTTSKLDSSVGYISIGETVIDSDGNGLITLSNTSNSLLRVSNLDVGNDEIYFGNTVLSPGEKKTFVLSELISDCSCIGYEGTERVCEVIVFIESEYGLEKKFIKSVSVSCVNEVIANNPNNLVPNLGPDSSPPVVSLIAPCDKGTYRSSGGFLSFSSTDDRKIISCTVFIAGKSQTFYNLNKGINTVKFNATDNSDYVDWNVSCTDGVNTTLSESKKIKVDISVNPIHCADYGEPFGVIDTDEVSRILAYWRSDGCQINPEGEDGYTVGIGDTDGPCHCVDLDCDWTISTDEKDSVLDLWRCNNYEYNISNDSWVCSE